MRNAGLEETQAEIKIVGRNINMQSTSCKMLDWMKHKLESRVPGEVSITSDMQMEPPLWQKTKRN